MHHWVVAQFDALVSGGGGGIAPKSSPQLICLVDLKILWNSATNLIPPSCQVGAWN